MMKKKLIVILGPTASGKSELAVKLALWLNSKQAKKQLRISGAEIISADSRQIYKGMNVGTGKITKKEMKGITHHLLDVASPKRKFTVAQYRKLASEAINKIFEKNMIPILCGGSAFYIQAVVDGIIIPEVRPDWKLRKKLEKKSTKELYQILKKLDFRRAKTIEKQNPRRLIRAIEIAKKIGFVPTLKKQPFPYPVLLIGIKKEKKELSYLIKKRLFKRLKKGMIAEVKKLKSPPGGKGLSWKRLEEFGLEYRYVARYLQGKINYSEMVEKIQQESEQFARRQMTWWKSSPAPERARYGVNKNIKWINPAPSGKSGVKKQPEGRKAEKLVKRFLENR